MTEELDKKKIIGAPGWSLKDAFIFLPVLASGLAIASEIGFFTRISGGAFSYFSFAEHIAFSSNGRAWCFVF